MAITLALLFTILVLRVILRKQWLAFGVFLLIMHSPLMLAVEPPALYVGLVTSLVTWIVLLVLLSRFSVLSVMAFIASQSLWQNAPFSPDWHRTTAAVFVLAMLALAA